MVAAAIVQAHTRAPAIADAVVGEWFSTGDMGWVDEDGYFYLFVREYICHRISPRRARRSWRAIVTRHIGRGSTLLPHTLTGIGDRSEVFRSNARSETH
jgi:hypothetical protein